MKKLLTIMLFFVIQCNASDQDSPLFKAIKEDNAHYVSQYIRDGAQLNPKQGLSALDYAILHNSIRSAELLLKAGGKRNCGQVVTTDPKILMALLQANTKKMRQL